MTQLVIYHIIFANSIATTRFYQLLTISSRFRYFSHELIMQKIWRRQRVDDGRNHQSQHYLANTNIRWARASRWRLNSTLHRKVTVSTLYLRFYGLVLLPRTNTADDRTMAKKLGAFVIYTAFISVLHHWNAEIAIDFCSRERSQFRYYGLPLCEYIFQQNWITANNTAKTKDARHNHLPHSIHKLDRPDMFFAQQNYRCWFLASILGSGTLTKNLWFWEPTHHYIT